MRARARAGLAAALAALLLALGATAALPVTGSDRIETVPGSTGAGVFQPVGVEVTSATER